MPLHNFNYLISWSDFITRASRPANVTEDAQIHPEISPGKIKLARKGKAVAIAEVDISITLVKSDCWVVAERKTITCSTTNRNIMISSPSARGNFIVRS